MLIYTRNHYNKNLDPGNHDGTITKFNGKSMSNNEDVHDKSGYMAILFKDYPDDYDGTNWEPVCPYFMDINGGGNKYLEASYTKEGIKDANANHEAHVACSTTIAQDMPNYDPSMCNFKDDDSHSEVSDKRNLLYNCTYTFSNDSWGFSSTVLNIYDDYVNKEDDAYIGVFNDADMDSHNNHEKISHWDQVVQEIKEKKQCPYYMVAAGIGTAEANRLDASFNKNFLTANWDTTKKSTHLLVSTTIAEDKEDYTEDDGKPVTEEDEKERAEREKNGSEARSGLNNDWNPDDPYGFHVGDQFCAEPRVVKGLRALGIFILFARFAVPILIIIFGSKDFINSIMSGKTDSLKQDGIKLGWRVVVGLFVFFVPTITNAFMNGLNYYKVISDDINQCQNCLLSPLNENYCKAGADATGSTDANKRDVDYTNIDTTRNASADGELGNTTPGVNAGKIDANTPNVDASKIDANTPGVNAGNTGTNTPNVNSGNTGNNPPVVIIQDPDDNRNVVTN